MQTQSWQRPSDDAESSLVGEDQVSEYSGLSGRIYPEGASGRSIREVFEGPDDEHRDPESGLGYLPEGFHVEELAEEAEEEERSDRFLKAQRQLVAAFFARRKNALYRKAATDALAEPDRPEPALLLLWNLVGEGSAEADSETQQEVHRWLANLSDEDFLFFTQDPDLDPARVMASGILPSDLRPAHLFREYRRRLIRSLIQRSDFFHPDEGRFEAALARQASDLARAWDLDEETLKILAREERRRFYQLHLAVCRASAAFVHGDPAPKNVPNDVVAEVASVAYGRMDHPSYKAQALAFAGLSGEKAREIFSRLDRFMEEFHASRLFTFLKRTVKRRRKRTADLGPTVKTFVKTFRTGIRPEGLDLQSAREIAALALFETYYGGFRGKGSSDGRPSTRYRPQLLTWGGLSDLDEAKKLYEAISDREALRQALFPAISKMAEEDRERRIPGTVKITIRTRSIHEAKPGDLAAYRRGSLREFSDGRLFAPSEELLSAYKQTEIPWEEYERRYLQEMRALYKISPQSFLDLLGRPEMTLVCYERGPDRCHRRILADILARIAQERGIQVILDIR